MFYYYFWCPVPGVFFPDKSVTVLKMKCCSFSRLAWLLYWMLSRHHSRATATWCHRLSKAADIKPSDTVNGWRGYDGPLCGINGDAKAGVEGPVKSSGKSWLQLGFETKGWRDKRKQRRELHPWRHISKPTAGVTWPSQAGGQVPVLVLAFKALRLGEPESSRPGSADLVPSFP